MNSFLRRPICIGCRILAHPYRSQQSHRSISARSAINKGIRETRDEGRSDRGGRDRSKGFFPRAQGVVKAGDAAPRRASLSERVGRAERERDRKTDSRTARSFPGQQARRERQIGHTSPDHRSNAWGEARQNRNSYSGEHYNSRTQTAKGSASSRSKNVIVSRSSAGTPGSFDNRDIRSKSFNGADVSDRARAKDSGDAAKGGILREIKNACRLIEIVQQRQAANEGIDGVTADTKASLSRINLLARSATFREHWADAVADLMRKKSADGTFVRGPPRDRQASVIFQNKDGNLDLAIGQGGPTQSVKVSRESKDDADDQRRRAWQPERDSNSRHARGAVGDPRSGSDVDEDDRIPVAIPYTTAASEFLYGYNSVSAALRARRRKIYKLYIHPKIFERESEREGYARNWGPRDLPANELVSLAKEGNVPFKNEFNTRILDQMSGGRPHNGLVLEVSKLPALPVVGLGKPDIKQSKIPVTLGRQTAEEAAVNGNPTSLSISGRSWRYPLVVLLDGITDPGNVGNILRTCHFYGVDAVAVAVNTCANLSSAVLAKASSGACEAVRLLSVSQPSNFIFESSKFRWKVFAAVAPTADARQSGKHLTTATLAADSPLAKHPCILMLGAEGEGLRDNLKNRADHFVSIAGGFKAEDAVDVGVDSMNVSVAAGVLLESFLRKPEAAPKVLTVPTELGF